MFPFAKRIVSIIKTKYSTNSVKLNPNFVTGFSDAESCFQLVISKNLKYTLGWSVKLVFSIHLHSKDISILYKIQEFFGVGSVTINKDTADYHVISLTDLLCIINHFENFPLKTKKYIDFLLFKMAYDIISKKEHLIDLQKLVNIRASLNKGLSEQLAIAFPNTIPIVKPKVNNIILTKQDNNISDINYWIAGFVTGEGCFFVKTSKSKTHKLGISVTLNFIVVQNTRDTELINSLKSILNCGSITINEKSSIVRYTVTNLGAILEHIIPIFDKYPILGEKYKDFQDFKKVSEIMAVKGHLTSEGLEKVLSIKSRMNFKR